ncbi:sporulation protein YpjB [Bacillus sp. DJP31]|uniref:sporulation protein YpjB n=1 Tax=Bacillus sp. DJP31 TaxID=3409789 RepID=UPI003BB57696
MSRWIIIFAIILICWKPTIGLAEHTDDWKQLDVITDQALQLVKHQKYEDAKKLLSYFSKQFSKVNIHEKSFSMDEIRIINATYEEAQMALDSESLSLEERIQVVTKFRLVVDAVNSEYQPLWTEMETSVMTTFQTMKEAVGTGDNQTFEQQLTIFLGKYEIIYPSVRLDLESTQSQLIDTYVTFLDESRKQMMVHESRMDHMQVMENELTLMFKQMKKDDADPSLIWVMISTGSIIILTLSYVGWRKYKGDKEKQASKRRLND